MATEAETQTGLLAGKMTLAWTLTCSQCGDVGVVARPDDSATAAASFEEVGWEVETDPRSPEAGPVLLCPLCADEAASWR